MHFLNPLDRDIEIVIRKKPRSRRAARIMVTESQRANASWARAKAERIRTDARFAGNGRLRSRIITHVHATGASAR